MREFPKISRGQLTALLFVGRLSGCLLLPADRLSKFSVGDCLLSTALNGLLLFLLFLPTLWLLKGGEHGVVQKAYARSVGLGKVTDTAYIALCVFILLVDMVQFSDFAVKTMHEGFSVWLLTVIFVLTCVLASRCGIQAIARASTPMSVFSALCLIAFAVALLPEMRWFHFAPQQSEGMVRACQKAVQDLPRTAEVAAIGLLYPYIKGSRVHACGWFSGLTALFSALVTITAVGVLGSFVGMTAYPFYTAVAAARIGILQRLDVLVTAVWLGTFFIRFTLFIRLLCERCQHRFGQKSLFLAKLLVSVLLIAVAFLLQNGSYGGEWQVVTTMYWWMLGLFCFILPVGLKIGGGRLAKA